MCVCLQFFPRFCDIVVPLPFAGLFGCSQGTDLDVHLQGLPQDDFPVIASQEPAETSEDNNRVEDDDLALGQRSPKQSLGTLARHSLH